MPSVANMSLIWSDIGSYIKSSFGGDQEDPNTNAEPPKKEAEAKPETIKDTKSPSDIEVKPLAPKETEDKPLKRLDEAIKIEPKKLNDIEDPNDSTVEVTKSRMYKTELETEPCSSKSSESAKCDSIEKVNKISNNETEDEHIPPTDVNIVSTDSIHIARIVKGHQPKDPGISSSQTAEDKDNESSNVKSDTPEKTYQKESNTAKTDADVKLNKKTSDANEEEQSESKTKPSAAKEESAEPSKPNAEPGNANVKEQTNDTNKKTPIRSDTQISKREVRDAGSASRSSSLLGLKRASSKSVPRKADYGKRALSLSDADKESSVDESDSENESSENTLKTKNKKQEKSTLKKRRKEIKPSHDDAKIKDDSDSSSFQDKPCEKDVPQTSTRKKSKAGAKRKPTDLSSDASNQELEEIKRLKHGDLETDESSSETHESQSDVSDTDEEVNEASLHLLPAIESPESTTSTSKTVDEPDVSIIKAQILTTTVESPRQLSSFYLPSITSEEPYNSILSSAPVSTENYKWSNETDNEKESENETKKEFNDVSKLREDQKKCMQRAKDLLKAAFSESESDTEESDVEGNNELAGSNAYEVEDDDVELS